MATFEAPISPARVAGCFDEVRGAAALRRPPLALLLLEMGKRDHEGVMLADKIGRL